MRQLVSTIVHILFRFSLAIYRFTFIKQVSSTIVIHCDRALAICSCTEATDAIRTRIVLIRDIETIIRRINEG